MKRFSSLMLLTVGLGLGVSQAAPIIGTLRIGGAAEVTLSTIDWTEDYIPGDPYNGTGTTYRTFGNGIFAPIAPGEAGTIVDRDALAGQPAGQPISVPNWLTFPSLPYSLELTYIFPGVFTSAQCGPPANNEDTCTPAIPPGFPADLISPYNLSNFVHPVAGLSSNANISVSGNVVGAGGEVVGSFNGILGAEFLGMPLEQVLGEVASGGSVLASYSGTINAYAIPEPASVGTAILGGIMLFGGALLRRRL